MSNLYTRLHSAFSSTRKAVNSIKPKLISTPQQYASINRGIKDLLNEKDSQKLVEKFKSLSQYANFRQNYRIYSTVIHRLTLSKKFLLIENALETQKNFICSEGFGARLIFLYGKAGMLDHAHRVFDELPQRGYEQGPKSFNALLGAASNSENFEKVYELFREVPSKLGIEPSVECYNTAAHALCKLGLLDQAVPLLDEMEEKGLKPYVVSYNTILSAFYGKGRFEEGEKVWERMVENGVVPDIKSYNFKLYGLINDGKVSDAMDFFMELKNKGLKPDVGTFNALIQGFCKSDNLDETKRWYDNLLDYGCVPNRVTFDTIVPFLCEKGDYIFAFQVCKRMFKRQCSVDASLLQKVVDGLANNSMVAEAKILVQLGRSNSYHPYDLALPNRGVLGSFI